MQYNPDTSVNSMRTKSEQKINRPKTVKKGLSLLKNHLSETV